MAGNVDIRITGEAELQRNLNALEQKIQKRLTRRAMKAAAVPLLARSQELAPVLTGATRDHLQIRMFSRRNFFGARVQTGTREEMGIPADSPWYYPAIVEYRGHPFMRPAVDETRAQVIETFIAELKDEVNSFRP